MSKKADKELQFLIGAILLLPILFAITSAVSAKNEKGDEKK